MNTTFQNKTLDPMLLTRPTQRCFAKLASGLLALSLLLGARAGAGAAQVATDQPDYAPGSTAIITGTGFAAGETVTLQVLHADGTLSTGDDHLPWTVLADPDGAFVTTWHVCEDDCVGSTLRLTAVGQTSGQTAEAFFTDSVFLINMNAPVPVSGGCMRLVPNPPPPLPTTSVQGFLQAGHTYQFSFTATTSGSPPPCFLVNPPSITFSLDPGFGSLTFTAVRVGLTTTYTNRVTIPAGACGSSLITFTCDGGSTRQVMASGFPLELVASFDCFNTIACQHPPTVSCPPPTVIPCTSDAGATATVTVGIGDADNDPLTVSWLVDGGLVSSPPVAPGATTASLVNYPFGFGPHTVKAIVSDGNSQPVTCETMVTVTAHDAPVPSLATLPTITVECSATIAERPTATDVCAAGGIVFGVTTDPLRYTAPGTYTITWIYLDPHDPTFFTTQPQTVVVNDTTPPILTLNGSATMIVEACAAPFVDPGATAIDTCDGVLAVSVGGDVVNVSVPGIYVVAYSATDSSGLASTASRTVLVQDTQPPVFTTTPANLTLTCGPDNAAAINAWLAGAAAADVCGVMSVTHAIAWLGPCGADSALVTWTATDVNGRTATATATLTLLPDRLLTGVLFDSGSLQLTLPANSVRQSNITVLNSGACPTIVQSAQIAASFQSPALSVLTPLPGLLCAGDSGVLSLQIDTTSALEGVYAATLTIHGADGGSQSLPIEIVVSGRLLPDLTANYTGGGVSFHPETSPVFPVTDEPFMISAAVKNVGAAPAGPFTVKFFEGTSLLGTAEVAGLGLGQSTTATLNIPNGFPVDGFYLIRAEAVPPAGGELRLDNNSASGLLQVGMPFVGTAFISVTASLAPDCTFGSATLSVHAEYVIVTDQATLTFPVQGGRVDALIQGTPYTVVGAHTDVSGNFSTSIGLPAGGNYTLEVTVTDFTLTETETFPVTGPSVPNCLQGGQSGGSGSPAPYVPPSESADLYLCSSDISFRTADGATLLAAPVQAGQAVQICAVVNYYTSLGRELNSQPVHFTARRQTADMIEEYFIGTALANFAGGGSTMVCVPWTVSDEGTFVVSVSLTPTITQFQANDLATRALVTANPAQPTTAIHVTAEGGAECSLRWVSGRATYEKPGAPLIPVVCGQITVRAYDESGTLLATVGGYSTDSAGNFSITPFISLPAGVNRIVVEVTDGTLTGSTEFTMECRPPNAPAPGAPPAQGDLYVFSEHIIFLAADCLSSWNRNPLPGETISVAADIHYFDNYTGIPLNAVPVDVNVIIPIGDALQSFNIAHTTVDFPFGGGSSIICVPWTSTVPGPQIVQVVINPDSLPIIPSEYLGNNAATRLIFVGGLDVVLTADPREQRIRPGQSASYALHGETLTAAHPTLNLAAYFEGPGSAPEGLTPSLGASLITLSDDTTLTLATTAATPPGTYRFYVVGSGDQQSAIARLTLIVEPAATPLEIACPADIAVGTDAGQCSAAVNFTVSASGGCSAPTVVCSPASGSTFSVGTTTVTCIATDDCGNSAGCQFQVTVINPPPTVGITSPASGAIFPAGTSVAFTGSYADNAGDTHTGGFMADALALPTTLSGGNATASYNFATPGVYAIKLTVTDACGQSATATTVGDNTAMIIVYDPSAGFVTGGGWIQSPAGAYASDPAAAGKANFGFVSKYKKGATTPTGETEFHFQAGSFNFHSTAYDWLVVSGPKAQYKGSGTINGASSYGFLLTATDGQVTGGGGVDKFRIKVWDTATDSVIYDNVRSAPDTLDSASPQAIGGGSIVLHK